MIPVHIAEGDRGLYFLRKVDSDFYQWFLGDNPTEVRANNLQEVIRLAYKAFEEDHFMPLHCGTKFPAYDRDEHGRPALFTDLVAFLASSAGNFFDEGQGYAFVVKEIPQKSKERALSYCQIK